MAKSTFFKPMGDWKTQTDVLFRDALHASMAITGRNGEQAVRHAIILMAQSAKKLTKKSKKNRKILRVAGQRPHLWIFPAGGSTSWNDPGRPFYLPRKKNNPEEYSRLLALLRPIRNQGLAKASWMWGLKKLGKSVTASTLREIRGVAKLITIRGAKASGYVLSNRLKYLIRNMPTGWQAEVHRKAANRIFNSARRKIESQWRRAIEDPRKAMPKVPQGLGKYFIKA